VKLFNINIGKDKTRGEYRDTRGNFVSRWARPPSRNTAEWLAMFSQSPRLAVVDRIASDLANVGGQLLKLNEDGSETEVTKHPFLDFMAQPNPLYEMTSSAIWRLHEIYLLLIGEGYFLIEFDESGKRPLELWNVPPHWVKMTPYINNPNYLITTTGGLVMDVPVDDIFVMKQLNPLDPFMRGLGSAESIADEVEIDEYAAKFQKRFFYNDATPPVVFSMPDATPDQRDAFMARWNQKYKGVENSHKAAALTGNVTVHELGGNNNRSLGFEDSRIAMRDAVLEHFGVPREIMGITENSNRATADSAQYIYAKNVLTPRIRQREEAINKQLLPLFGDNLIWRYDAVIPYDKDFDKAKAMDAYNAGLITKNEARGLIDMPDIDGGNVFKASFNDLFLKETDDPAALSQSMSSEIDYMAADNDDFVEIEDNYGKKSRRINLSAALRNEDRALRENERVFEATISRHFVNQKAELAKALGLTQKAEVPVLSSLTRYLTPSGNLDPTQWVNLTEAEQQLFTEGIAQGLLNWGDESKTLTEMFRPLWKKTYDDGVKASEEGYGLFGIQRPEFTSAAKINGGKRVVGIERTTQESIADIIARGISNGVSQTELKQAILSEMDTSKARAKIIARQETTTALATGQFDMMKNAGAGTKTWHHRPQNNPRDGSHGKPNHVALEGETVPLDAKFSNGLSYPRDPANAIPEEVINCRCYVTYGGF
jgi:HK97 family phage portal protein